MKNVKIILVFLLSFLFIPQSFSKQCSCAIRTGTNTITEYTWYVLDSVACNNPSSTDRGFISIYNYIDGKWVVVSESSANAEDIAPNC